MNEVTLTLDLNKKPSNQRVVISKNDIGHPVFNVIVTDNGEQLKASDMTDYSKEIKIRNPGGGVIKSGQVSVYASGMFYTRLNMNARVIRPGETFGYVELSKQDQTLSTARFAVTILDEAEVR